MHVLGFGGSALIVMAVTMRSVVWLRSFGLAGSLLFVAYGVVLGVWPVVVTNVVTASIHAYQLRMLIHTRGEIHVGREQRLATSASSSPRRWARRSLRSAA